MSSRSILCYLTLYNVIYLVCGLLVPLKVDSATLAQSCFSRPNSFWQESSAIKDSCVIDSRCYVINLFVGSSKKNKNWLPVGIESHQYAPNEASKSDQSSFHSEKIEGFDELYAKAPAAKKEIDLLADKIAAMNEGSVAKVPIKSLERSKEKVINDYGGDPTRIKDLARNTIVVPQDKIPIVVGMLREKGAMVKVIDGSVDPLGYSGVNSKIKTSSGLVAEIQVNSPEMIYAKESPEFAVALLGKDAYASIAKRTTIEGGKGHELYEKWRSLKEDDPRRKKIEVESKNYYTSLRSVLMPIKTGEYLNLRHIFIDYPFESVMFRRDHQTKNIYRKFYGEEESQTPIPSNNRLFNDALRHGQEISQEEYLKGKGKGKGNEG
ncbi:hypothetical protein MJO52_13225 [Microbulbifer variabilis]|uniref:Uncharacterized protein n=1 Tax=Microbulbifer variabilis TaxID=266805 RepID=A0ABY4V6Y8_9GAMM|nr:hypothetical protein [Microbulbifer variabilis]USD20039.1 hypothetical protein MJO52_13225 [Microbulbifer variabilis]